MNKKGPILLIVILLVVLIFWGCPTKRYIPDPKNPQPQVYYYKDVGVDGRAPHVGPKVEFRRMLALFDGAFVDISNAAS